MSSRTSKPSQPVPSFGLIGWLEKTRVVLPLKGVECEFAVHGELLSVEVNQIFHQSQTRPIDCLYSFPLPADAAIYRCEMHVNGRIIAARIEERARAVQIAREKKAAGYRTSLVEAERDNLFTLSLGNVQPGDAVVIRLAYFQVLSPLGDWTSFQIPVCPGVRYVPGKPLLRSLRGKGAADDTDQVPDASRISPPRIDALHPDAAYFCVEGRVASTGGEVHDLSSPSHPVLVREEPGGLELTLATEGAVPDRSFVARWTTVAPQAVSMQGWRTRAADGTYLLLRLAAPQAGAEDEAPAQDYYFLLDRSGSMQGLKWQKTVQAFHDFLRHLRPADRVWATLFNEQTADVAEKPLAAAELLGDRSVLGLERLGADGGTELLPALNHVLTQVAAHSKETPASVVIITDGQVGNEGSVLERARRIERLRIHTFGIDTAVNDGLLRKLAEHTGGSCVLLHPADDISGAVARSVGRLGRPILTAIDPGSHWEPADDRRLDLHAGETRTVTFKATADELAVDLKATSADGERRAFDVKTVETAAAASPLLWAKTRIAHQLWKGETSAAIGLAKQANLLCEGVAFVAWDEAEKVPVAGHELYQPAHQQAILGTQTLYRKSLRSLDAASLSISDIKDDETQFYSMGLMASVNTLACVGASPPFPVADAEQLSELIGMLELCEARAVPTFTWAITAWASSASDKHEQRDLEQRIKELIRSLNELRKRMEEAAGTYANVISELLTGGPLVAQAPAQVLGLLKLIPREILCSGGAGAAAATDATRSLEHLAEALERIATLKMDCRDELGRAMGRYFPGFMLTAVESAEADEKRGTQGG